MNNEAATLDATHEAEDSLIGAILIESTNGDRQAINAVAKIIIPGDFHSVRNRRIYTAMLECSQPPHQINVAKELHASNRLEELDCAYLRYCVSIVPCSLDYEDYAQSVKHFSDDRQGTKRVRVRGAV